MRNLKLSLILTLAIIILPAQALAEDFPQNFFGAQWVASDNCDNLQYAKNMGYHYIIYKQGMEYCTNAINMKFFFNDQRKPSTGYDPRIDLANILNTQNTTWMNKMYAKKSNGTFPNNIATGWFDTATRFNPLMDIQQDSIIKLIVNDTIRRVNLVEKPNRNFTFAGYTYDVPQLKGDFWDKQQKLGGNQIDLSFWTGKDSAVPPAGITYDYATWSIAQKAFYKQLIAQTKASGHSEVRFIIEPYFAYTNWIKDSASQPDYAQFKPDLICDESPTVGYFYDTRVTGKATPNELCTVNTYTINYTGNMKIVGELAKRGGWHNWYGFFGGRGDLPNYQSIRDVPAHIKMFHVLANWENMNHIPIQNRSYDPQTFIYNSPDAHADPSIIYSTHPENGHIYVAVLNNQNTGIPQSQTEYEYVYTLDSLFNPSNQSISYQLNNGRINLPVGAYMIIRTPSNESEELPEPEIPQQETPEEEVELPPIETIPDEPHSYMDEEDNTTGYQPTYEVDDLPNVAVDGVAKIFLAFIDLIKIKD